MTNKAGEQPTITQADRDAAADYMNKMREPIWAAQCHAGNEHLHGPTSELVQAFARHRTTSLAAQDGLVDAIEDLRHNYRAADAGGEFIIVSIYSVNTVLDALSEIKGDK